ncbi:MAG: PilN domain-containing protein [Acidobacteriota bacterium]|nr:PilN domain-containing protein [Acidobacteriota bacterium]
MLKTNLSTRPFYNERRVHLAAALVALVVVAFSVWNIARLVTLSSRRTALSSQIDADERAAADLRTRASTLESGVDMVALGTVAAEAREANTIVDGRRFSWTAFFNRLEETLPAGVMLASVAPSVERGEVTVAMVVVARRAEDVDEFMERLEGSGAFGGVSPVNDAVGDDGLHHVALRARYLGGANQEGTR